MAAFYKTLTTEDVVHDVAIVTSGVWQDGASSITTFYTSSIQSGSTGDYALDVYRYNPSANASASVQFGVAYGHYQGSGSLGTVGATGDRTSAAVWGQFNSLVNPPQTTKFTFSGKSDVGQIYALSLNRARIREEIEPGGWELWLGSGANRIKLIDDSSANKGGNTNQRNFLPEYNVVSGSLVGGTTIKTAATAESATYGSYGTFYPKLGLIMLNPVKLATSPLLLTTASASNADGQNNRQIFDSVVGGAYFQMKRQEEITSRHYFVRATSKEFNATTNETYYTESVAGRKEIITAFASDPKTYVTSVGLYNSENELLAIAKLSKPILKSRSREALIKVKLDF